jgi:polyhydroxyalkanoate synthesis regulator protein
MPPSAPRDPIVVTFHRQGYAPRAVLFDANLDLHELDDLRGWVERGIDFVVIDDETGEDITRIVLA